MSGVHMMKEHKRREAEIERLKARVAELEEAERDSPTVCEFLRGEIVSRDLTIAGLEARLGLVTKLEKWEWVDRVSGWMSVDPGVEEEVEEG